jgi:hypothetical protein
MSVCLPVGLGQTVVGVTLSPSTDLVSQVAAASTAKRLDGKNIAFFHIRLIRVFDERDLLISMNAILFDIVAGDVPDCFHRESLAADIDLITLHDFLDGCTDVTHSHINPSLLSQC